jgi:hypothetical protein
MVLMVLVMMIKNGGIPFARITGNWDKRRRTGDRKKERWISLDLAA